MVTQAKNATSTDRIEKVVTIRAPRSRVWRAITDAREFATWFEVKLDGAFVEGRTVRGFVSSAGYEHLKLELQVQKIEAERYFAYRWHPYPSDPQVDYSAEHTTLVEFTLEETADGTMVTIVESGFDQIPLARRAEAFRMHTEGWVGQAKNLERYVA